MATPHGTDDPQGHPTPKTDTLSVSDILRAHKATSQGKLFGLPFHSTMSRKGSLLCYNMCTERKAKMPGAIPNLKALQSHS